MNEKKEIRIIEQDSEADTCRKEVAPQLKSAGWDDDQILEQRTFTPGKIIVIGRKARRKKGKRFDYLLRYSTNFPIAIVEAKKKYKNAADGMQQAKEYAEILGLQFAYSTNGKQILEFDFITGLEKEVSEYPTPHDLWKRLNSADEIQAEVQETYLKPFVNIPEKPARYYQTIAINRATKTILDGKNRALLTLATGTGKTTVAFQIIHKLWNNRWNRKGEYRRPKVLFLADRSVLVDDPHSKDFALFGDARCLISEDGPVTSREIYFSTYQAIAEDDNRTGLFRKFPTDFFDLIVIDECHRGSASEDSNWKTILKYFTSAVQLGLTATPLRDDNKDTYAYFGNPLYTYSLRQGIEDGFLAPYIVHRVVTDIDASGFRPQEGQVDKFGESIPDGIYGTSDFERTLSYLPRTKAVARHLFDFMIKNGRYDKTIIFCVDQEHADQMRRELNNLNNDISKENPNYVVRIVSDEGDIGKGHLSRFMDIEEEFPVIVTTSKMLSTGVDVPTCRIIVLFRIVNSMTEFKQIIGRGTRVRDDKKKLFFTILDYTGSASRNFADPDFDGEPPLITSEQIDEDGQTIEGTFEEEFTADPPETDDFDMDDLPPDADEPDRPRRKLYVEEGEVTIAHETVQITDASGKLRTVQYSQYAKEQIQTMFPSLIDLQKLWSDVSQRNGIFDKLEDRGVSLEHLAEVTQLPDADPFDLLCHVAFDLKPQTRKQRADLLKKNKPDYFAQYSEQARDILNIILDKYVKFGLKQIDTEILKTPPISDKGNIIEIANEFGGVEKLKKALEELQQLLYAA
jgi:type I restriction enzyme, R subunit